MRQFACLLLFIACALVGPAAFAAQATTPAPATTPSVAEKPMLGVKLSDDNFDAEKGLLVQSVIPSSTAAVIGIVNGDYLQSVNGKTLKSRQDLETAMTAAKIGDPITVSVLRGAEVKNLSGTMLERPKVRTIDRDLNEVRKSVAELKELAGPKKDPSLAEVLQELKDFEEKLPEAVEKFKKQYPNGEFRIKLDIEIVSDKTAKEPVDLMKQDGAEEKKQEEKKPETAPAPKK